MEELIMTTSNKTYPISVSNEAKENQILIKLRKKAVAADSTNHLVKNQLIYKGHTHQNKLYFSQTHRELEVQQLRAKIYIKNKIDKSEYPSMAAIEAVNLESTVNLWHGPTMDKRKEN